MYMTYLLYIKIYICKYIRKYQKYLCSPSLCGCEKCSGYILDILNNGNHCDIYRDIVNYNIFNYV